MNRADVLVVGCGAMGSAASYNIAKRGAKVVTLERFGLNHEKGSSHGQTRIIRLAYYEDPRYVPILRRAYASWREAEARSGKRLLATTGGLMVGRADGELVSGVVRSAREHSIPHKVMSAREAEERFPAFTLDEEFTAVHEESAGVLFPEECIGAFVSMAKEDGCEFRFGEQVTALRSTTEGIEVVSSGGRYLAGKVVLCAGGWNGGLLGGLLPLTCERQVPFWFSSRGESRFDPDRMPVFMLEEKPGVFYYGIPEIGRGVKVARTHGGEACDPDSVRREVTIEDSSPVVDFVSRRLSRLAVPPIASTTCLYTNTPDQDFAIGTHPEDPRITVISACSGHGFKFASVMGEVAADLALTGTPSQDVSFLRLDRFLS